MIIHGVICNKCQTILYVRHNHDYRTCDCKSVSVDGMIDSLDGGWSNLRIVFENEDDFSEIKLRGEVVLRQILAYDRQYESNLHGKYRINENSNMSWFKKLIIKEDE